ncbi:MAG: hypothetical protein ABIX01_04080 [Chitinophagaceae bacterium]
MGFRYSFLLLLTIITLPVFAWQKDALYSFPIGDDVSVTIDLPRIDQHLPTTLIIYALPNGNTTAQTMGKKLLPGDDWHFDIQHIKAQTAFVRNALQKQNIVVAYLENKYKSWPQFKKVHPDYTSRIPFIVDTIFSIIPSSKKSLHLNGHSGGGSFIFGYLQSVNTIPAFIKRISFLDSDYGYDSSYLPKLAEWLHRKDASLNVFAYNDSVALLDGKPFVSATGGTWYRSKLMMKDLSGEFPFIKLQDDSLIIYKSKNRRIHFFFKTNPERKIYHTVQVERNGFIHSVLCGTKEDSKGYFYFGKRAYDNLVE